MRFERLAFYLKDDEIEGDAVGEGDCPGSAGIPHTEERQDR